MTFAPICLFVYNRPYHTQRVINSLISNHDAAYSELIVYSDGIKDQSDRYNVRKVRNIVKAIQGFKSIEIIVRKENFGLSRSIISGVGEVLRQNKKIIVLEDDMIVSPYFLKYMNDGLNFYEKENRVISIHGYKLPLSGKLKDNFFLRGADCWGWATWKRGWELFRSNGKEMLKELESKSLTRVFDFDDTNPYTKMLHDQINGKIDSWAIRWHASAFLADKLTLYPSKSLVRNIGMDGTGTHCPKSESTNTELSMEPTKVCGIEVNESLIVRNEYKKYFRHENSKKKKFLDAIAQKKYQIRNFLKLFIPPVFLDFTRRFRLDTIYFSKRYYDWEVAESRASGYESKDILDKNLNAALKVRSGQFSFERDSVLFQEPQYVYPLVCGLIIAQQLEKQNLIVLDYGGSLGSLYFQHSNIINRIENLSWNILEQPHFVSTGKEHLEDKRLKFFDNIEEFHCKNKINLLVLSSVLQYLQDPYEVLNNLMKLKPDVIVIDRTSFLKNSTREHLRIQNNPTNICKSSYPCWFLLREKLEDKITSFGYEIESRHDSADDLSYEYEWGGVIFRRLS